jgi:hypothetical protein
LEEIVSPPRPISAAPFLVTLAPHSHVEFWVGELEEKAMSESFMVEVWGEPAGFVQKEGDAFRFHAIARPFFVLEDKPFNTLGHARLAAASLRPLHPAASTPVRDCCA